MLLLFSMFSLAACINPSRVFLVDKIGKNFLFRTSTPVEGQTYDMNGLQEIMADKLAAVNLTFPENANMHAYSLISIIDSIKERFVENKYFDSHPQYEYTHHAIIGSLTNPAKYSTFLRQILTETYPMWNYDKLDVLTQEIRENLEKQEDEPKIIYFHCLAGEDRTGEVFGGYVMRYLDWTYQQSLDFDNSVETRQIQTASIYGMQWYCYYLNYTENKGGDCSYSPAN